MSLHSHDNAHIKQVLSDVISISMSHIQDIALKLKDLNITEENLKDQPEDKKQRSIVLNNILTLINDAIHPAHNLAKELYPDATQFIELCQQNHKLAIERKLISSICHCYSCKVATPV